MYARGPTPATAGTAATPGPYTKADPSTVAAPNRERFLLRSIACVDLLTTTQHNMSDLGRACFMAGDDFLRSHRNGVGSMTDLNVLRAVAAGQRSHRPNPAAPRLRAPASLALPTG